MFPANLHEKTPYDLVEVFFERNTHQRKFEAVLPQLIDLALSYPQICEFTHQEIFMGSLICAYKKSKSHQDELNMFVADCGQKEKQICSLLASVLQEI